MLHKQRTSCPVLISVITRNSQVRDIFTENSVAQLSVNLALWPSCSLTLQWRHNEPYSVSNHQPHDCLLNRLFRRRSKKHQSSASLAFVRGIHRGPGNSPHKWPVMRKIFPFDDVIMKSTEHCHFLRSKITAIAIDGIKFGAWTYLLGLISVLSIRVRHMVYCLVLSSCCKWRLVWGVNFALHAKPAKLWCHNDLIYARRLIITFVSTTFHCSKRHVHNGNNVRWKFDVLERHSVNYTYIYIYGGNFIERGYESPHVMHLEKT